jgi:hypothetical protein
VRVDLPGYSRCRRHHSHAGRGHTAIVRDRKGQLSRQRAGTKSRHEQQGTIARPLDDGVLSHGRARTPARGPAAAPSSSPPATMAGCAAALSLSVGCRRNGEGEEKERKKGEGRWEPDLLRLFFPATARTGHHGRRHCGRRSAREEREETK